MKSAAVTASQRAFIYKMITQLELIHDPLRKDILSTARHI